MIEEKKEKTAEEKTAVSSVAPEATIEKAAVAEQAVSKPLPAPAIKPEASKGEKWFDWLVYRGLNYWINLGSSLVIANHFINGKGKPTMQKLSKAFSFNNKHIEPLTNVGLDQLTLNSGGWILCLPIMYLENRKRQLVHKLNDWLGADQTAADGHKMTADEIYIEKEQPKQSLLRVLGRRTLASGSTMVFGVMLDKLGQETHTTGHKEPIGGKQLFTDFFKRLSNNALNSGFIPGGKSLAQKRWVQDYLSLAVLDVVNTEITSTIMHWTNGAGKQKAPHEIGDDAPPAKEEIGNELKPGEHLETVAVPDKKKAADSIIQKKPADQTFAQSVTRDSGATSYQLAT